LETLAMARAAEKLWTIEDFLAFDDGTDTRYELIRGRVFAMAPPSEAHGELVSKLTIAIGSRLRPACRVVNEAGILVPGRADTYYQADLAVTCAPRREGQIHVAEPAIIVEVPSPSTAAIDLNRKVPDYRTIPSVEDILVVSSTEPRVEHWQRAEDGWRVHDFRGSGEIALQSLAITISVAGLYQDLLPAEPAPGEEATP
jgi:Uma2 family endonuclease